MTSNQNRNDNLITTVFEALNSCDSDSMKFLLEAVLNMAMKIERDHKLNADPYERSEDRQGYANGFKPKTLNSRVGKLSLTVPQTRGIAFYPGCLEKGLRFERALNT